MRSGKNIANALHELHFLMLQNQDRARRTHVPLCTKSARILCISCKNLAQARYHITRSRTGGFAFAKPPVDNKSIFICGNPIYLSTIGFLERYWYLASISVSVYSVASLRRSMKLGASPIYEGLLLNTIPDVGSVV